MKIRTYFSLLLAVFLCFLIFIPNAFSTPMAGDTIYKLAARADVKNGGRWSGLGNVRVMNLLRSTDSYKRQDQPVLVPEPATIMLSGLGLIFMGVFFRRKFIK